MPCKMWLNLQCITQIHISIAEASEKSVFTVDIQTSSPINIVEDMFILPLEGVSQFQHTNSSPNVIKEIEKLLLELLVTISRSRFMIIARTKCITL